MELDFTRDDIEKMLFKRASTDKKWMNILAGTFDERFFSTPYLGTLASLQVRYYEKYGTAAQTKALLSLMKAYAAKNPAKDIDIAKVTELLNEISTFDLKIPDEVANSNMKEFIRRNAFYNALYDNAGLLRDDESGYEKVVTKCLENFDRVQKLTFNDTDLGLNYFDSEAMERHWDYIRNPEAKISTGWAALDAYTHGGFLKDGRSLYLFMAQAGLGKSLFMSNLAVNFLKNGLSVVVISLEMSEDVYAQRFDAHISKHDINKLREHETSAIEEIKNFYKKHPTSNLYIKEYPPKSVTCNEIKSYLESLKNNGHHFDAIIVDYLNIVKSAMKTDSMFVDGLDVSEKLRAISYDMKCPVISAIQTNREGMNNENVGMQNISQSSGIAFTADFLMSLYQTEDDRSAGQICGRILKNRLGGMIGQTLTFEVNPHSLVLEDKTGISEDDLDDCDDNVRSAMSSGEKMEHDVGRSQMDDLNSL
jgi:replicative DNA helicase